MGHSCRPRLRSGTTSFVSSSPLHPGLGRARFPVRSHRRCRSTAFRRGRSRGGHHGGGPLSGYRRAGHGRRRARRSRPRSSARRCCSPRPPDTEANTVRSSLNVEDATIPSNPPSEDTSTSGTTPTKVASPPRAGTLRISPAILSETSADPSGRNVSPHGASSPVVRTVVLPGVANDVAAGAHPCAPAVATG